MREPDLEGPIAEDAPAVAWMSLGPSVVAQLGKMMGLPEADVMNAQVAARADYEGKLEMRARAWRLEMPRHLGSADVDTWVVQGPFNVFWQFWLLMCVHLREEEGVPAPELARDGASHEFVFLAVHPDAPPVLERLEAGDMKGGLPAGYLTPHDLVHQVVGLDDDQARQLMEWAVEDIVAGRMSPDSDFRGRWKRVLDATAEHLRYGTHPSMN